MVRSPPGLDPFLIVLKMKVISIVDVFHGSEKARTIDSCILEKG